MKKSYIIVLVVLIMVLLMILLTCSKRINNIETDEKITTEREISIVTTEIVTDEIKSLDTKEEKQRKNIIIAIDPGHQGPNVDMSAMESNAPGSDQLKAKATGGTEGRYSGIPEYQLNLDISLMLRDKLIEKGYDVILTREDNDTAISNAERAKFANENGADMSIRIHANGNENTETNGALVLICSGDNPYVGSLYEESYNLGNSVLSAYCEETGMKNLGIQYNDTMTGINWSQIPVIILEMGFMTNEMDDLNMADTSYRQRMVAGIVKGIQEYYGKEQSETEEVYKVKKSEEEESEDDLKGLKTELQEVIAREKEKGNCISICVEDIETESRLLLEDKKMKSASLIKLFVAGCVYEQIKEFELNDTEEIDALVNRMLSKSDNDAANTLILKLGKGSAEAGFEKVNKYCEKYAFSNTSMGRLMLDFDAEQDNYTSVSDCVSFLKAICRGELVGSTNVFNCLKKQERTGKLPAGVPKGVQIANKTGELEDVENDAAIVLADHGAYIVAVMMGDLQDTSDARETIKNLSTRIYNYMENY